MVPSIVRAGVIAKFKPYILVCTEWDEILFDFFSGSRFVLDVSQSVARE